MPKIVFVRADSTTQQVEVPVGYTLMEGATENRVPGILARCGGGMLCGTCHVYVCDPWKTKLAPAEEDELDRLDAVYGPRTGDSRLSCQLEVGPTWEGMVVCVPDRQE